MQSEEFCEVAPGSLCACKTSGSSCADRCLGRTAYQGVPPTGFQSFQNNLQAMEVGFCSGNMCFLGLLRPPIKIYMYMYLFLSIY